MGFEKLQRGQWTLDISALQEGCVGNGSVLGPGLVSLALLAGPVLPEQGNAGKQLGCSDRAML